MSKKFGVPLLLVSLLLAACQGPNYLVNDSDVKDNSTSLTSQERAAKDAGVLNGDPTGRSLNTTSGATRVKKLGDGLWVVTPGMGRYQPAEYAFWVDIQVENLAYEKTVGIRWTKDHWTTVNTAFATYETDLGSGNERWGVDVKLPTSFYGGATDVEYAVFATMEGQTSWDPGNNYFIGDLAGSNLKFIGGKTINTEGSVAFTGMVRVKNLGYEKKVQAHYTTDSWRTTQVVEAVYVGGNDWTFTLPLTTPTPVDLEIAVSYEVAGQTWWDNNKGQNYRFALGPHLAVEGATSQGWLSGRELLRIQDGNGNTGNTAYTAKVNGRPMEIQSLSGTKILVNTLDFYPATALTLEVTATDAFGFTASKVYNFSTTYNLEPTGVFGTQDFSWPYNLKASGDTLLVTDHDKSVVGSWNPNTGVNTLIPIQAPGQDSDRDSQGRLVVLRNFNDPRVEFYSAAGLVKSFSIPNSLLNIPVALEVKDDILYIGSYVDHKILKLSLDGQVVGSIPLEWFQKYKIVGDRIYLVSTYPTTKIQVLALDGTLVREIPLSGLEHEDVSYPEDIAVGDGFIALIQSYKLLVLDNDGHLIAKWTGRDYDYVDDDPQVIPGRFGSVVSSVEVMGRDIYVGDFGAHSVHKFTLKP